MLAKKFTDEEILEAFNQMDPRKSPRIDGFSVNHLKASLPLCISQNQSAFLLGRMIHDNILIAHELMHYLQSSKNRPNKGFVIKLDMSKAYDRVEWNVLKKVMKNLGFEDAWVDKFIRFVRLVKYVPEYFHDQCELYGDLLRMRVVDNLDNYLGLPLSIGKKKSMAFHLNRFSYRIDSWSKRLLFYGGCGGHEKKKKEVGQYLYGKKFASSRAWESLVLETYVFLTLLSLEDKVGGYSPLKTRCVIIWQVGDGNNIDICKDKWGFEGLNSDSLHCTTLNLYERKVHNLWLNNHLSWNKDRVHGLYGCFAGDCIFNLPTLFNGSNDSKKTIWKLKTLPKIRVFAWRVGHELLPTNAKISSIRQSFRIDCPRSGASVKTLIHPLKDCPTARATLTIGGLNAGATETIMFFVVTRMKLKSFGKGPKLFMVKLNFDATISKNKIGFGVIVRDFDGLVLSGGWGFKDKDMMVDWEKLYALEENLKITRSLNIPNAIFETDCASLANRVKKGGEDIIIIGYHIK
ncbi:hypothetical protein Golax_024121 [Gossypium laxum]|uniref:Reverse transcriptase zinc-binding domain-containing protein n=1 Tax=Gossypium laxum TaxID=34288 RepID=A0A7J8ZBQ5_9ROSI|nr:hypothetical protein [Gossypium laxum]